MNYFKIEFRQYTIKQFTLAKLPIPSSNNVMSRILLFNSVKVDGFSLADIILQSGAFSTLNSSSDWLDVGRLQYVGDRYSSNSILKITKKMFLKSKLKASTPRFDIVSMVM